MYNKSGITLSMLVITIIILTILAGTIVVTTNSSLEFAAFSNWVTEIQYIQDVVDEQLNSNSAPAALGGSITLDTTSLSLGIIQEQFSAETINVNGKINLRILNLGQLNIVSTVYGNLKTEDDVYAISEQSGKVYYVKGIVADNTTYYTLTENMKNKYNLTTDNNLNSVVFKPNIIGYTNQAVRVDVNIPKTFNNINITTNNSTIQISSVEEKEGLYKYVVNTNDVNGNYTITVTYNNGQLTTTTYEVSGYDITIPIIQEPTENDISYRRINGKTQTYLKNITATDDVGIKIMKYVEGQIEVEDIQEYFELNGRTVANGTIVLNPSVEKYTFYAEDYAGNFNTYVYTNVAFVPVDWQDSVYLLVDSVPIPNGFAISPYGDENEKQEGLVIYELNYNESQIPKTETQYVSWTTRNQYVWIPVDDFEEEFVKSTFSQAWGNIDIVNTLGETNKQWEVAIDTATNLPLTTQDTSYMSLATLAEVQAMYASVKKYGGFYVARYEMGIDYQRSYNASIDGTVVHSKLNKIPFNCVSWASSNTMNEDTGGIVEVARGVYNSENINYGVVSTLIYDVQWDTIVNWMANTKLADGVTAKYPNLLTDGSKYGNYAGHEITSKDDLNVGASYAVYNVSNWEIGNYILVTEDATIYKDSSTSWALTTGALKVAKINNIYDMLGNMYEWTMGGSSTNHRIRRGSYFYSNNPLPITFRDGDALPKQVGIHVSSRLALYLK